jgi:hypothetical protein
LKALQRLSAARWCAFDLGAVLPRNATRATLAGGTSQALSLGDAVADDV